MSDSSPWTRLVTVFLLLGLAQAAHSMEEMTAHLYDFFWIVTGIVHARFAWFAQFRMAPDTFAVLNMSFITLLLGSVSAVRARQAWALGLAALAGVIETLNGLGHLSGAVVFRGYVPGALTAPFLLVLGILTLRQLWRERAFSAPARA
jgi:hypothetical protein